MVKWEYENGGSEEDHNFRVTLYNERATEISRPPDRGVSFFLSLAPSLVLYISLALFYLVLHVV